MSDDRQTAFEAEAAAELDPERQRLLAEVPKGTVAVAGAALLLLLVGWLALYLFVYLPRGMIG